jgi:ATP-dependent RNA helicase DDX10/DBP4
MIFFNCGLFDELPLSRKTLESLKEENIVLMTAIQKAIIPHALHGKDILGAAKTGSGKTLSFLLPLIEKLYRLSWDKKDGIGGLILAPTRELALQIFDELCRIGKYHTFSSGLVIGGKGMKEEYLKIHGLNIIIGTPGRVLQHMDETPGVELSKLQILVLDETDQILGKGFKLTLDAIVKDLNRQKQTLLLSATQVKNIRDLAKLSLHAPEYISSYNSLTSVTPLKLMQLYLICNLQEKLDLLWSFIKTHLKCKIMVFFATSKQARFVFETFRRLRPGISLRCLSGKMNQMKRQMIFHEFCFSNEMALICTDLASRGLNIPSIDWVIQVDCPTNINQYIHRVGRTARYRESGRALILLTPSESEGMLLRFQENRIPIKTTKVNHHKRKSVTPALQALILANPELKTMAMQSVKSYIKFIFFAKNRDVFKYSALPWLEFSISMGLTSVPYLHLHHETTPDKRQKSITDPVSTSL